MSVQENLVWEITAYQNTPCRLLARVCSDDATGAASPVDKDGKLLQQADISSISIKAFTAGTTTQVGSTQTPAASDVISNTLQTTGIWEELPRGGNFKYTLPAALLANETDTIVEASITLTGGTVCRVKWLVHVEAIES